MYAALFSPLQKDADDAVVVALTSNSVFESGADEDEVYGAGIAFPLLQVVHALKIFLNVVSSSDPWSNEADY